MSADPDQFPVLRSFLDLIRHGKHHNQHQQQSPARTADTPKHAQSDPTLDDHAHRRDPSSRASKHQQAQAPQPHEPPPDRVVSPGPREVAEMIVNEEREASAKMPTYKGLENFKLLEKMGESVHIHDPMTQRPFN